MKPVQRILEALAFKPLRETPVTPVMLMQGARMLGLPLTEYYGAPNRIEEGQARLVERFDTDAVFAFPHLIQDTMPWGAGLHLHDDGPPTVDRMVITQWDDIPRLTVPDPTAHPYLRATLAAAGGLARRFKGDRLVVGALVGPFTLPSLLMGARKYLTLLMDPELRQRYHGPLMEKTMAYTQRWAQAQFAAGCDLVVVAEGVASATMLEERTFASVALPVMQRFLQQPKGGLCALEMVGDGLPFMRYLKELPVAGLFLTGADSIAAARQAVGRQKVLLGNLNNLHLLRWTPERVEFEARKAISEAGPGFILTQGGPELPWHVPDANIEAMIRAARRPLRAG